LPLPNIDFFTNKDGFAKTTFVKNLYKEPYLHNSVNVMLREWS